MLFRTLKKITDISNPTSPKFEYIKSLERRKTNILKNSSPLPKNNDELNKRRLLNDKITKQLEEKNAYIGRLENEKLELLNDLRHFYIEIVEMMKMDHNFGQEFKDLLLSLDLKKHLESYNEQMILKNIREILKNCLDLRWRIQSIEEKDFREEEKDYVIMYRRLEIELKKSLYNEEQLKFMNEVLKCKIQEFISYQNDLIEKTKGHLFEAKEEYMKLMDFVSRKDFEIGQLQTNNDNQKNVIQSLEERILSIFVLEYKIKNLDQENQKKNEKMKKEYEEIIKKLKFVKSPTFEGNNLAFSKSYETENKIKEEKIKNLEKLTEKLKYRINNLNENSSKQIQNKDVQIQNLKENLSKFQKQNYHFSKNFYKNQSKKIIANVDTGSLDNNIRYFSASNKNRLSTKNSESQNNIKNLSTKQSESQMKSGSKQDQRSSLKKGNFFYTNQDFFE